MTRRARPALAALVLAAIGGLALEIVSCAPMLAVGTTQVPGAVRDSTKGTSAGSHGMTSTGSASTTAKTAAAVVDTTPSADALQVLATIADPLPPADRVPPPAVKAGPESQPADSTGAEDDTSTVIPIPTPVPVLGEVTPGAVESAPSSAPPAVAPPMPGSTAPSAAGAAAAGAAGAASATPPAECWRIQIGAPKTAEEGESRRKAAESLLLIPMVVDRDEGLFKVRTRECFDRAAAEGIRDRAKNSGFDGAFLFDKNTAPAAAPKSTAPKSTKPPAKKSGGKGK